MADGKVVIETKLDNSGVESGIKSLKEMLVKGVKGTITALGLNALKNAIRSITIETNLLMDSVRKASTLFGNINVNTELLAESMARLATSTGVSSDEIGEALYNALSAGVEATEDMGVALEFVEKAIKTSKAGFASLGDTVTATASVLNAYGMATEEAERVQGILIQTQNKGITTVGELASTLAQVVPTASAFGVTFEEVGASLATMTAQGTKTAQATTSLNALLAELGKNGQTASDNLKKASVSAGLGEKTFSELVKEGYNLADILLLMQDYAKKNNLSLVDMFGSIEAGKASLQLINGEGKTFNEILESMNDTAGLVEKSFDRVFSNVDRLKNTFTEIKRIAGVEFSSIIEASSGSLADFLEKIAYNGMEASLLESAFNNLTNAIVEYEKAQEIASDTTEELGNAMTAQATIKLTNTLLSNIDLYNESAKSIENLKKRNVELKESIATASAGIEKMAKKFGMSIDEVARKYATGELLLDGALSDLVYAYEDGSRIIVDATAEIASNNQKLAESEKLTSEYLRGLLQLYKDGAIDAELFKMANYELYESMMAHAEGYKSASEGYANIANDVEKLQKRLDAVTLLMNNAKDPVAFAKWAGYVDYLTEAIANAQKELKDITDGGSDGSPTSNATSYALNPYKFAPPVDDIDEVWDAYQNLNAELREADEMYKLLGDEYDIVGAKTSAYQSAIERLSSAGIDMNRASVQRLIEEYENLLSETDKLAKKQEIANKVSNVLSTSFKAFADSIANTEKRLKELDKELADVNDDIADGEKEKLELLEEIADAQARNDEEDEERARKRLEALEEEIKGHEELKETLETEAKEVKSGQSAWKALGKSALESLAQILQGLGDELTARAVLATLTGNFAGAISAGIGASGAYIASSAIKSKANSFEQGGIVQQQRGVSPTGDNHIVFANAGELILNQAQQANLADQIRAMSESMGARNAVIVNMSGSYIYGLNEPAVGRAIHDNIETLRAEGVL